MKVRKKVKTAGDNNPTSLFHTTFGSFNKAPSYNLEEFNMEDAQPVLINEQTCEYAGHSLNGLNPQNGTPTLPNFERKEMFNQGQGGIVRRNQPEHKENFEYSYQHVPPKAKSS